MVTQTAPQPYNTRTLWLGLLAGPLTWIVYFMIGYLLVEAVCKSDFLNFSLLGLPAVSTIILILTAIGVFITIYAGFISYRKWRQGPEAESLIGEQLSHKPVRFMALAGLLLSGLFTLIILMTGISVFILRPC
jgi:hypothetical protein